MYRLLWPFATLLALGRSGAADDLPSQLVARPATLPDGMLALSLGDTYDSQRVLGVRTLDRSAAMLGATWGISDHWELGGATLVELTPDVRWTREALLRLAYGAWRRGVLELAPSVTLPLSFHTGVDATSTVTFGANLRWHASERVLIVVGQRLLPVPVRPAAALDVGLDGTVLVQLDDRWAAIAQVAAGELTLVGQIDRGVAPWNHLLCLARLVFATSERLDVGVELRGDVLHVRDQFGVMLDLTRRL
jgi:hypothetical protein